jgi:hypothetical protein
LTQDNGSLTFADTSNCFKPRVPRVNGVPRWRIRTERTLNSGCTFRLIKSNVTESLFTTGSHFATLAPPHHHVSIPAYGTLNKEASIPAYITGNPAYITGYEDPYISAYITGHIDASAPANITGNIEASNPAYISLPVLVAIERLISYMHYWQIHASNRDYITGYIDGPIAAYIIRMIDGSIKSKVKLSRYMSCRHIGGEKV